MEYDPRVSSALSFCVGQPNLAPGMLAPTNAPVLVLHMVSCLFDFKTRQGSAERSREKSQVRKKKRIRKNGVRRLGKRRKKPGVDDDAADGTGETATADMETDRRIKEFLDG